MVTLSKGLHTETMPAVLVIECLGARLRNLDVTALKGKVELRPFVLHEVEGKFRVSLILQIGDDRLADEVGVTRSDHLEHIGVPILLQGELEHVFRRVDRDFLILNLPVQAIDHVASHRGEVDRGIESSDDTVIPIYFQKERNEDA